MASSAPTLVPIEELPLKAQISQLSNDDLMEAIFFNAESMAAGKTTDRNANKQLLLKEMQLRYAQCRLDLSYVFEKASSYRREHWEENRYWPNTEVELLDWQNAIIGVSLYDLFKPENEENLVKFVNNFFAVCNPSSIAASVEELQKFADKLSIRICERDGVRLNMPEGEVEKFFLHNQGIPAFFYKLSEVSRNAIEERFKLAYRSARSIRAENEAERRQLMDGYEGIFEAAKQSPADLDLQQQAAKLYAEICKQYSLPAGGDITRFLANIADPIFRFEELSPRIKQEVVDRFMQAVYSEKRSMQELREFFNTLLSIFDKGQRPDSWKSYVLHKTAEEIFNRAEAFFPLPNNQDDPATLTLNANLDLLREVLVRATVEPATPRTPDYKHLALQLYRKFLQDLGVHLDERGFMSNPQADFPKLLDDPRFAALAQLQKTSPEIGAEIVNLTLFSTGRLNPDGQPREQHDPLIEQMREEVINRLEFEIVPEGNSIVISSPKPLAEGTTLNTSGVFEAIQGEQIPKARSAAKFFITTMHEAFGELVGNEFWGEPTGVLYISLLQTLKDGQLVPTRLVRQCPGNQEPLSSTDGSGTKFEVPDETDYQFLYQSTYGPGAHVLGLIRTKGDGFERAVKNFADYFSTLPPVARTPEMKTLFVIYNLIGIFRNLENINEHSCCFNESEQQLVHGSRFALLEQVFVFQHMLSQSELKIEEGTAYPQALMRYVNTLRDKFVSVINTYFSKLSLEDLIVFSEDILQHSLRHSWAGGALTRIDQELESRSQEDLLPLQENKQSILISNLQAFRRILTEASKEASFAAKYRALAKKLCAKFLRDIGISPGLNDEQYILKILQDDRFQILWKDLGTAERKVFVDICLEPLELTSESSVELLTSKKIRSAENLVIKRIRRIGGTASQASDKVLFTDVIQTRLTAQCQTSVASLCAVITAPRYNKLPKPVRAVCAEQVKLATQQRFFASRLSPELAVKVLKSKKSWRRAVGRADAKAFAAQIEDSRRVIPNTEREWWDVLFKNFKTTVVSKNDSTFTTSLHKLQESLPEKDRANFGAQLTRLFTFRYDSYEEGRPQGFLTSDGVDYHLGQGVVVSLNEKLDERENALKVLRELLRKSSGMDSENPISDSAKSIIRPIENLILVLDMRGSFSASQAEARREPEDESPQAVYKTYLARRAKPVPAPAEIDEPSTAPASAASMLGMERVAVAQETMTPVPPSGASFRVLEKNGPSISVTSGAPGASVLPPPLAATGPREQLAGPPSTTIVPLVLTPAAPPSDNTILPVGPEGTVAVPTPDMGGAGTTDSLPLAPPPPATPSEQQPAIGQSLSGSHGYDHDGIMPPEFGRVSQTTAMAAAGPRVPFLGFKGKPGRLSSVQNTRGGITEAPTDPANLQCEADRLATIGDRDFRKLQGFIGNSAAELPSSVVEKLSPGIPMPPPDSPVLGAKLPRVDQQGTEIEVGADVYVPGR